MPFLVHGEVTDPEIDIFDREAVFIERVMRPLRSSFPALSVVFEHITTKDAAQYVAEAEGPIAATITAHHLLYNRNEIFKGGIRPHYYCLPILKREEHRLALMTAAASGDERFFLGTDSAPHAQGAKEMACGCAGCYTALHAMELYAEAFERAGALDKLEAFASFHGPAFYGLPRNTDTITLKRESWTLPDSLPLGDEPRDSAQRRRADQLEDGVSGHAAIDRLDPPLVRHGAAGAGAAGLAAPCGHRSVECAGARAGPAQPIAACRWALCRKLDLPEGVAYEEFIGATGGVPTRDNLHDFFNAPRLAHFPADQAAIERLAGGADRPVGRGQIARAGARRRDDF